MSNLPPPGPPNPSQSGPPKQQLPPGPPYPLPPSGLFTQCWDQSSRNQGIAMNPTLQMQQQRHLNKSNTPPWIRQPSPWQQAPYPSASAGPNLQPAGGQGPPPVKKKRIRNRPKHKKNKLSDSFVLDPSEVSTWVSDKTPTSASTDRLPDDPPASDNCDQASCSSADSASLAMSSEQKASDGTTMPAVPSTNSLNLGASSRGDFAPYLNTKDFSDVTLVTDADREFCAHKIILAARSHFFANAFKENQDTKTRIEITDVKGDIFEQVLNFIYTGEANFSHDNVNDLCVAAEKFALCSLKNQCTEYLIKNLNTDNAAKLLVMSSDNNMPELKRKCTSFISSHPHYVIETEEYKKLATTHPALLDELYRNLVHTVYPTYFMKPFNSQVEDEEHQETTGI